ncbi:hypothetical protein [Nocardia sp. MH4]|uniref:hypothetical protein n=1 Tax=Nocardia sp. MH4 TaxID=1768677 RepID=UPI001C4E808A|nr:hypothetical protein [Nocardia sp. MH4]
MNPQIQVDLLNSDEFEIVKKAVETSGWSEASVRPFTRFGFSGAKMLVVERIDEPGVPQILKISTEKDISEELRGLELAKNKVAGVRMGVRVSVAGISIQGVLYELHESADGGDGVADLNDIYNICLDSNDEDLPNQKLFPNLDAALGRFGKAHVLINSSGPNPTYGQVFRRYQREKHDSRIARLFEGNPQGLHLHGVAVPHNPLGPHQRKLQRRRVGKFRASFIHGDLHPSNIVLSDLLGLDLIDFAWAHTEGHLFLDYVMLESSMRFKAFPRDINPHCLLEVDRELNRTLLGDAYEIASQFRGDFARRRLTVMAKSVMTVRERLASVLGNQGAKFSQGEIDTEYQRVMYLVLAGQEKFQSFPLLRTTLNLHLLREALDL